jgi:hypothetical protein
MCKPTSLEVSCNTDETQLRRLGTSTRSDEISYLDTEIVQLFLNIRKVRLYNNFMIIGTDVSLYLYN